MSFVIKVMFCFSYVSPENISGWDNEKILILCCKYVVAIAQVIEKKFINGFIFH